MPTTEATAVRVDARVALSDLRCAKEWIKEDPAEAAKFIDMAISRLETYADEPVDEIPVPDGTLETVRRERDSAEGELKRIRAKIREIADDVVMEHIDYGQASFLLAEAADESEQIHRVE